MNLTFSFVSILVSIISLLVAMSVFCILPFLKRYNFSWDKRIALTIALLFMSIFSLHLSTYTRSEITLEIVLDSFLVALRTFLADGGITINGHFAEIDEALKSVYKKECISALGICIKIVAAIGDIAAPLLTLTTVISVLSQLFPKIKIAGSVFREKFVFSAVNEETVTLAENIHSHFNNRFLSPMLIVTDAYVDDENEKSSELVDRLKKNRMYMHKR